MRALALLVLLASCEKVLIVWPTELRCWFLGTSSVTEYTNGFRWQCVLTPPSFATSFAEMTECRAPVVEVTHRCSGIRD